MSRIQEIIEGLQIFARYPEAACEGQHDVIYAMCKVDDLRHEDTSKLEELGWNFNNEVDSWCHYT